MKHFGLLPLIAALGLSACTHYAVTAVSVDPARPLKTECVAKNFRSAGRWAWTSHRRRKAARKAIGACRLNSQFPGACYISHCKVLL